MHSERVALSDVIYTIGIGTEGETAGFKPKYLKCRRIIARDIY